MCIRDRLKLHKYPPWGSALTVAGWSCRFFFIFYQISYRITRKFVDIEKKKSKQCKIAAVYTTITGFLWTEYRYDIIHTWIIGWKKHKNISFHRYRAQEIHKFLSIWENWFYGECDHEKTKTYKKYYRSDQGSADEARLCPGEHTAVFSPVSYTHLDVYKRQQQRSNSFSITINTMKFLFFRCCFFLQILQQRHCLDTLLPVSQKLQNIH